MKPSEKEEVVTYLEESLKSFRTIKGILSERNKTVRIKAMNSIAIIVENRMEATIKYVRAGGVTNLDSNMTRDLYTPILQYLADEASK